MVGVCENGVCAGLTDFSGRDPGILLVSGWDQCVAQVLVADDKTVIGIVAIQNGRIEQNDRAVEHSFVARIPNQVCPGNARDSDGVPGGKLIVAAGGHFVAIVHSIHVDGQDALAHVAFAGSAFGSLLCAR